MTTDLTTLPEQWLGERRIIPMQSIDWREARYRRATLDERQGVDQAAVRKRVGKVAERIGEPVDLERDSPAELATQGGEFQGDAQAAAPREDRRRRPRAGQARRPPRRRPDTRAPDLARPDPAADRRVEGLQTADSFVPSPQQRVLLDLARNYALLTKSRLAVGSRSAGSEPRPMPRRAAKDWRLAPGEKESPGATPGRQVSAWAPTQDEHTL
jgi:hypothetical protein